MSHRLQAVTVLSRLLGASCLAFVVVACTASAEDGTPEEPAVEEGSDALSGTGKSVSLLYEGTCEFLRSCSTYSRNLPVGQVSWGCEGVSTCDDTARWVAGPYRSYCGKTVKFCKGTNCTTALVKDVSVSHSWEGSNGLMEALSLPHGLSGRCSGFGGGKVSMTVL